MKTESNIKPAAQFEIEALPKKEGAGCTVILFENIEGPFIKPAQSEEAEGDQYYTYDRYTVDTIYRETLQDSVQEHFDEWLQKGIDEENSGSKPKTELEILKEQVQTLQTENAILKKASTEMNTAIDDLVIASLGGDDLV